MENTGRRRSLWAISSSMFPASEGPDLVTRVDPAVAVAPVSSEVTALSAQRRKQMQNCRGATPTVNGHEVMGDEAAVGPSHRGRLCRWPEYWEPERKPRLPRAMLCCLKSAATTTESPNNHRERTEQHRGCCSTGTHHSLARGPARHAAHGRRRRCHGQPPGRWADGHTGHRAPASEVGERASMENMARSAGSAGG